MPNDVVRDFLFVQFEAGAPAEFLRVGTFTDMHGNVVEITPELLGALVANFDAGAAGQEVPIDVGHEKAEAAGWVKDLRREGDRLVAVPDWTSLGRELVGERLYRYMSATIDLARKVLKSISLTNFPAVKGLRPVELSEGVYTLAAREGLLERVLNAIRAAFGEEEVDGDDAGEAGGGDAEGGETFTEQQEDAMSKQEMRERIRAELLAEMADEAATQAELREQIRDELRAEMAEEAKRRAELRAFADEICGGEAGLSTPPEELVELMAAMPQEQVPALQQVLRAKVVNFSEPGSSQDGQAEEQAALPEPVAKLAATWVDGGGALSEFFEINADVLGAMEDYDLSAFDAGGE
jgi:hypothetical protein